MSPYGDISLLTAPGAESVVVRCKRTGREVMARVDDRGIVREAHGPAAYSKGAYELVEEEP